MTATNKLLAERASEIAKGSDGLRKTAARTAAVALAYSPSIRVAREALGELEKPDVRRAALELLEELTTAERAV